MKKFKVEMGYEVIIKAKNKNNALKIFDRTFLNEGFYLKTIKEMK